MGWRGGRSARVEWETRLDERARGSSAAPRRAYVVCGVPHFLPFFRLTTSTRSLLTSAGKEDGDVGKGGNSGVWAAAREGLEKR